MFTVEYHLIRRIRWQFFLSLTFGNEKIPCSGQEAMCKALLRRVAIWYSTHFMELLFAVRREQGERGRWHLHALVAGLPETCVTKSSCEAMKYWWEHHWGGHEEKRYIVVPFSNDLGDREFVFTSEAECVEAYGRVDRTDVIWIPHNSGYAEIDVFDARLNGVRYTVKTFGENQANLTYEVGRFGGSHCQLMLSKSVSNILQANTRRAGLGANGRVGYLKRVRRWHEDNRALSTSSTEESVESEASICV